MFQALKRRRTMTTNIKLPRHTDVHEPSCASNICLWYSIKYVMHNCQSRPASCAFYIIVTFCASERIPLQQEGKTLSSGSKQSVKK